jgi:quinol monooxygenase YgiN
MSGMSARCDGDHAGRMTTLHVDNTVHDYDTWKDAFDRYEGFRKERGVRSYRIARDATDPQRVFVDLDFDDAAAAIDFRGALEKIWATPLSQQQMIKHGDPLLLDVVVRRTL